MRSGIGMVIAVLVVMGCLVGQACAQFAPPSANVSANGNSQDPPKPPSPEVAQLQKNLSDALGSKNLAWVVAGLVGAALVLLVPSGYIYGRLSLQRVVTRHQDDIDKLERDITELQGIRMDAERAVRTVNEAHGNLQRQMLQLDQQKKRVAQHEAALNDWREAARADSQTLLGLFADLSDADDQLCSLIRFGSQPTMRDDNVAEWQNAMRDLKSLCGNTNASLSQLRSATRGLIAVLEKLSALPIDDPDDIVINFDTASAAEAETAEGATLTPREDDVQ